MAKPKLTPEEQAKLEERAKESDEVRSLRKIIREELEDLFDERFESADDDEPKKPTMLEGLFGSKTG